MNDTTQHVLDTVAMTGAIEVYQEVSAAGGDDLPASVLIALLTKLAIWGITKGVNFLFRNRKGGEDVNP